MLDALIIMAVVMPIEWMAGARAQPSYAFRGEDVLWSAIGFAIMVLINWNQLLKPDHWQKRAQDQVRKDGSPCDRKRLILWRMLPIQVVVLIPVIGMIAALADCFSIFRSSRYTLHVADTKVVDLRPSL
jgi:hypothetical protein